MVTVLWWIFGIYTAIAYILTLYYSIEAEDLSVGLAKGLPWLFWLSRATFRNMLEIFREG